MLFPGHLTLKHLSTVYKKHGKELTNAKRWLLGNLLGTVKQKKIVQSSGYPPLCIFFWVLSTRNFLNHRKCPPHDFVLWHERFSTSFLWYPLYGLLKFSNPTDGQCWLGAVLSLLLIGVFCGWLNKKLAFCPFSQNKYLLLPIVHDYQWKFRQTIKCLKNFTKSYAEAFLPLVLAIIPASTNLYLDN